MQHAFIILFYKSTCVFWIMTNERNGVMHYWWYIHDWQNWHINFLESTEKMYKTIPFLFWYVFSASVWSSINFCVTSLGAGKAGPPPVWLRLFLFTAASNFAVEQALVLDLLYRSFFAHPPLHSQSLWSLSTLLPSLHLLWHSFILT